MKISMSVKTIFIVFFVFSNYVHAIEKSVNVLFINSYHRGYSWSDDIENSLRKRLTNSTINIEFSVEYLDSRRFTKSSLNTKTAQLMKHKYDQYPIDIIITSDNAALDFIIENRPNLFPKVPVVFCGYNNFRSDITKNFTNVTGVNEEVDLTGSIDLAISVHPKAKTLAFIVSKQDLSSKRILEFAKKDIFQKYQTNYEIVLLQDLSVAEIGKRLNKLSENSILFIAGQTSDEGIGRKLTPIENSKLIADISPIPTYGFWQFNMGTGVLGGKVLTGNDQGREAAFRAIKIINGLDADSLPVMYKSPVSTIFDYTVMKRLNIPLSQIPSDSIILNQPHSVWKKYHNELIFIIIVFVLQTLSIIALINNIRKRKKAIEQLNQAKVAAETANKAKSNFLSNMSHEFRTPMHGILSYANMGVDRFYKVSNEKKLKFFNNIKISGERLLVLLNDLLDFAKLESGKMEMKYSHGSLKKTAISCIAEQQARLNELNQEVIFIPDNISGDCEFDDIRIGQVITNLLSNAIKYTKDGEKIEFLINESELYLEQEDKNVPALVFSVRDYGKGIPEGEFELIFNKFEQGSDSDVGTSKGTGLGLPICKKIIDLHRGEIWAENNSDGGAILNFIIPVEQAERETPHRRKDY